MAKRNFKVRALGEIAIRCRDMPAMVAFYRDVVGLEPIREPEGQPIVFFRIAEGLAGIRRFWRCFATISRARDARAGARPRLRPARDPRCIISR
ncbi:hypothetical protein roselon_02331 [Roseibacterium elongatum DSM 19469]|uniref:Glyoxalase/fosfomycin resistance/dioxygenase domain-containing protein n=1 Tax=Roseicyclus elongatus DSM 19469 TaxID=1294273 RepID=W8S6W9_9RHOB|nr:VOC family protein [Roseibacterium elongatum]AHM04666.1 hypothetical protein roselon_02331 [Roseibacterium elongatum DSM 19469]